MDKKVILLAVLFSLFILSFIPATIAEDAGGEVTSYWKFDEDDGAIAYDLIGLNHGWLHGATWTTGKINGALGFNGIDTYVETPFIPNFSSSQSFTVEAWFKTDTVDTTQSILGVRRAFSSETIMLGFHEALGLGFHLRQNAPLNTEFYNGFASCDDKWHHITGVFNAETNLMELYLDGQFVESEIFDGDLSGQTRPLYIGAINSDGSPVAYFNGSIDGVKIYNYALSAKEILANYGQLGYWKFDDGNGTTAEDSGGYHNNGTLNGEPQWVDGIKGKALEFDGIDDYVTTPLIPSFESNQDFTLEAWYKTDVKDKTQFILGVRRATNAETVALLFHQTLGLGFQLRQDASHNTEFYTDFSSCDNNWHYIVGVFNEATDSMDLYLDGQLIESGIFDGDLSGQTRPIYIGATNQGGGSTAYFDGSIDEVKISNKALTVEEIQLNYDNGVAPVSISINSPIEGQTYNGDSVLLDYEASEESVGEYYSLDGGENNVIDGSVTLTELAEGEHSIPIYAENVIGEIASDTVGFYIDPIVYGVNLDGDSSQIVEEKETASYTLTINNTGDTEDTFNLFIENLDGIDASSLNISSITLTSGESDTIILETNGNDIGTYQTKVRATSISDNTKSSSVYLTTEVISSVDIEVNTASQTINKDDTADYILNVTNTGNKAHIIDLIVSRSDIASLSSDSVILNLGESADVLLSVNASIGEHTVDITAQVQDEIYKNDAVSTTTFVTGEAVYGVVLTSDEHLQFVNQGSSAVYTLTIQNIGNAQDDFSIEVEKNPKSATVTLGDNLVTLAVGESITTTLEVTDEDIGAYPVWIKVTSQSDSNVNDKVQTVTLIKGTGLNTNIFYSTVTHSGISESTIENSIISTSVIADSTISESVISESSVYSSTISNSELEGITVINAQIEDGYILLGNMIINDVTYEITEATKLSDIVSGSDEIDSELNGNKDEHKKVKASASNLDIDFSINKSFVGGSLTAQRLNINPEEATELENAEAYLNINPSDNIKASMDSAIVKVFYDTSELGNLDESTLKLKHFNANTNEWEELEGGVNTDEKYVWANTTSFSVFGLTGDLISSPPPDSPPSNPSPGGGPSNIPIVTLEPEPVVEPLVSLPETTEPEIEAEQQETQEQGFLNGITGAFIGVAGTGYGKGILVVLVLAFVTVGLYVLGKPTGKRKLTAKHRVKLGFKRALRNIISKK